LDFSGQLVDGRIFGCEPPVLKKTPISADGDPKSQQFTTRLVRLELLCEKRKRVF
jgi:hypothetical protein